MDTDNAIVNNAIMQLQCNNYLLVMASHYLVLPHTATKYQSVSMLCLLGQLKQFGLVLSINRQ